MAAERHVEHFTELYEDRAPVYLPMHSGGLLRPKTPLMWWLRRLASLGDGSTKSHRGNRAFFGYTDRPSSDSQPNASHPTSLTTSSADRERSQY